MQLLKSRARPQTVESPEQVSQFELLLVLESSGVSTCSRTATVGRSSAGKGQRFQAPDCGAWSAPHSLRCRSRCPDSHEGVRTPAVTLIQRSQVEGLERRS